MNSFYRVDYASSSDIDTWMREGRLPQRPVELSMKVRAGNFVLAAKFHHATRFGEVRAIGRVVRATGPVEVEWRRAEFNLRPSPQGVQFWNRDHFKFAASVVRRYMLEPICAEHFQDSGAAHDERSVCGESESAPLPSAVIGAPNWNAGHVYVLRSPYGYKIGKTRNLRDRTRLFAVKLPFPIEVLMAGWFADYSATERQMHRQFAAKRLEGEWFDLNDEDLKALRTQLPMIAAA
jgi:hypothetical protein